MNSLRFKLILFSFGSILFALFVAGVSIDILLADLYGDRAEQEATYAYEMVYEKVKNIENNLLDQGHVISVDPAVVAPVNLINRYQDIKNYQPLVFNKEKKNLAKYLLERMNVFHRVKVAIYDKAGKLIAFSIRHDLNNIIGITTYRNNEPIYLHKDIKNNVWKSQLLPPSIDSQLSLNNDWDSLVVRLGEIQYFSNKDDFTIESIRVIQRERPDETIESIGFVKITSSFDEHYIEELMGMSHVNVSLILANKTILNKPDKLNLQYNLDNLSSLFGSTQHSKRPWLEHEIYYIQSYVLPVVNGKIFVLISRSRSELDSALNKSRYTLLLIFLLTASLAITFGIYWLNTRISMPLNKLTEGIDKIEKNEYPEFYVSKSKDEISQLGNGLNKMVEVIKSREAALKISQIDLNEAQHLAIIGSWKLDISNNKIEWSDEVYNIFEQDSGTFDLSYEAIVNVIFPDDRERVRSTYINSLRDKQSYDITYRLQMKDGSIKYIHEQCETEFNEEGRALTSKGTIQDITEKKYKDEIVSRTQKMDALGKLTGGVAHDYNNMLGVILGYAELLQSTLMGDDKQHKYLNEILAAGERSRVLTKKLLAFSRKEDAAVEVVDINKLLLEEQNLLEKTLTARIDLVYDLEDELWNVSVDKSDIQNAVLNMSINAMHAIADTGKLTIQTSNVHLDSVDVRSMNLDVGDYVLLSVTDTGIGMDEEVRSKLFDPFFSTKGEEGTGLGMTQVYAFVQQVGGSIYVYSEPGHGSRISIYIPRISDGKSQFTQKKPDVDEQVVLGHETILVVDDEAALRELASEILSSNNYRVLCVSNGIEALKILETESVDLMLSDVIMPDMDGYQLAEKVHELYPDIAIQMASGFSDERHLNKTNEKFHQQRLQKPFTAKILLQKIRQVLEENKKSVAKSNDDESSELIQWSNEFSSGLNLIDADHKKLISLINNCKRLVDDNQYDELSSILDDLHTYVDYHFKREELIMEVCDYPDLANHRKLHEDLIAQVGYHIKEYGLGHQTAKSLLEFLMDWLNSHVMGKDFEIAPYCMGKDKMIEQAFKNAGYDYQPDDNVVK